MKYIKTFESFSPVNEGIFGIDFSKISQAVQAVKNEVETNVIPNMDRRERDELVSKAQEFAQKSGIKSESELVSKIAGEAEKHQVELEEVAAEENISESMMINEEFGERVYRFFKRLGTYTGIGVALFGLASFASHVMGYIDFHILTRLNEITENILGSNAGPLGLLIMIAGVLLALGSQIWGYKRGV